jgi:hypothetical protein
MDTLIWSRETCASREYFCNEAVREERDVLLLQDFANLSSIKNVPFNFCYVHGTGTKICTFSTTVLYLFEMRTSVSAFDEYTFCYIDLFCVLLLESMQL